MSYKDNYKERLTAKKHYTRVYTDEEIEAIRKLLRTYYEIEFPNVLPNTNQAYFNDLADAINKLRFQDKEIIKPRYLCGIYNNSNSSEKNSILKMESIKEYLLGWLGLRKKDLSESGIAKSVDLTDWNAKPDTSTPQWADYIPIPLKNALFKRFTCDVFTKSPYYRLGFKFVRPEGKLFGDGSIQSQDNNFVIHVGKNYMVKDLFITTYKNGILAERDKYTNIIPTKNYYNFELYLDDENFLHLKVNDEEVYKNLLNKEICNRVYMLAWADGNDFNVKVKNIKIDIERV